MPLFQKLKILVFEERYVIGQHASERVEERGVLLKERLDAQPNPIIEVSQILEDGTMVKAVWSYLGNSGFAKFVTVHYFDEE
jgi:hypothetical protein